MKTPLPSIQNSIAQSWFADDQQYYSLPLHLSDGVFSGRLNDGAHVSIKRDMAKGCPTCLSCFGRRRKGRKSSNATDEDESSSATSSLTPSQVVAALHEWAEEVRLDVVRAGFTAAFKLHVDRLASACHEHPKLVDQFIDSWLRADPFTAHFIDTVTPPPLCVDKNWAVAPVHTDRHPDHPVQAVVERDGHPVRVYRDQLFNNWAGTLQHTPAFTFVPRTKIGVTNIVDFALRERMRVRVAGGRHSSLDVYGASGDVCISMIDIEAAVPPAQKSDLRASELEAISFEGMRDFGDGREVGLVRLGAAATAGHFREWALSEEGGNWKWMIPALPALLSTTSAGWTQAMCHGTGIAHPCVSDMCVEIEIVNCKGELQTIHDVDQMRAVAGGFGLLGVVVSQIFKVDRLKLANFFPVKMPMLHAVPPFNREDVPKCEDFNVAACTEESLYKSRLRFDLDCRKFYAEWVWYPFQEQCWINCWDVAENTGARPCYPDDVEVGIQKTHMALARTFEVTLLRVLPPKWQADLLGFSAMRFLPGGEIVRSNVVDALHFRRVGFPMPVRKCEIGIEIPIRVDGTPDFSVCQRAWWMGISAVYAALPGVPMRTMLEMRIIGGSKTILSGQRGNDFGTCALTVTTSSAVDEVEWRGFVDTVVGQWSSLVHPLTGKALRVRPHFATEWPSVMRGVPVTDFLKREYNEQIPEFKRLVASACADGGYTMQDSFATFGTETLLDFLGEQRRS